MPRRLTRRAARTVMLAAQGLASPAPRRASKGDLVECIRRMHVLQIDTIHVVARSPYLVLWSRLGAYPPHWLDGLLASGTIFEQWAHAMSLVPIEDYPLWRRRTLDALAARSRPVRWAMDWLDANTELADQLRSHLAANGDARIVDFEASHRPPGGWWNWRQEKDGLEALFYTGEVMIARRENFHRVYAPRSAVLPDWHDAQSATSSQVDRTLALRAVKALGVARAAWVPDYFRQPKTGMPERLAGLAAEGHLTAVEVEDLSGPVYVHADNLELVEAAVADDLTARATTLLSPFDPLVWDRARALELFDFDYRLECYTPEPQRRYGYFSLPILRRDRLVGRLDAKAHRRDGVLAVRSLHLEAGTRISRSLAQDVAGTLNRFAAWQATPELAIGECHPTAFKRALEAALAQD